MRDDRRRARAGVPAQARCYTGDDGQGSFYWIALPEGWKNAEGVLVMHAHGGPADTGPARLERSEEDLKRWAITVKAGYAWAGATYRRGGYGVRMAAADVDVSRRVFWSRFSAMIRSRPGWASPLVPFDRSDWKAE